MTPLRGSILHAETHHIDTKAIADILGSVNAIGWHPGVYFNDRRHALHGQRPRCIVGVMTDPVTGRPTGAISRTFLDCDLRKIAKAKLLGKGGGVIRLSPDEDVQEGLHLTEGLESALTAAALGLRPVWSTGSNTTMARFPVLAGIEALTIFADHDANGAGERAAGELEARWLQEGREVRTFIRDKLGDINDALRECQA
jgi:hypothetical protein